MSVTPPKLMSPHNFLFLEKAHVIHWVQLDQYSSLPETYLDGKKHLEILMSRVQGINPSLSPGSVDFCIHEFGTSLTTENMTREKYKNAVLQAKEHIASGDIFQIVLSQRFERRTFADPFEVYRGLRIARGCTLVASSPETLVRVKKVRGCSLTCWDALQAALHVGTICGAPKVTL
ncbi:hypothetical protein H5410_001531 [Solanum commersonii]|uniref:Chorismate-utilising enzyme C-terminal domain-containing protein n=1 Tax=Solanum commersonii TaxID=4109 RepID=A0A9J6AZ83_SOLCO|nr:hypothetical protein H5410_001531 [Solanum commersonii]